MKELQMTGDGQIPFWRQIGYASGNFAKSIQSKTLDFIYLFYLVEVIGISASLAGLILLLSLLWDGLVNPFIGYAVDTKAPGQRNYRLLLLFAAPMNATFFFILFLAPAVASKDSAVVTLLSLLLFRTTYTIVDIPHNAMLASITTDSRTRSTLSVLRYFFSALAAVAMSIGLAPALRSVDGSPGAYIYFVALTLVPYTLIIWLSAFAAPNLPAPPSGGATVSSPNSAGPPRLWTAVKRLAAVRKVRLLALICAVSSLFVAAFVKFTAFYAKTKLGDVSAATTLLLIYTIGQIIALPVWLKISHIRQKDQTAIAAHGLFLITAFAFLVLTPTTALGASLFFFAAGFAFSGVNTMNWALIPDLVEYTNDATGNRHEALTFGLFLLLMKAATGISLALIGWLVDASGYSTGGDAEDVALMLTMSMAILPAIGSTIAIALLHRLKMTHEAHARFVRAE